MKYIFILNSFGKRDIKDIYQKIEVVSKYLNLNYQIEVNSTNLSTNDILKKYQNTRNIIVAVGGDGMINKVLNGIVNTNNMLSYIPYGTGNDLDKTVKETLQDGRNIVDLVRINDRYFINIACFGIDADIANDDSFIHNKYIPRNLRYNAGVIYHFLKYKAKNMEIAIDSDIIDDKFTTVAVCNARYYGGGYKIAPGSLLNDGLVEVYLVKELDRLNMAKTILSMKDGSHELSPYVKKIRTDSLNISSDIPISSNIDGEILTASEFDIEVEPKAIEIFNNQELIEKVLKK